MKHAPLSLFLFAAILLAACAPEGPDLSQYEAEEVGSYRDPHGCISSAGYVWSALLSECVRTFEIGAPLLDAQDPEATSSAALVRSADHDAVELFLPLGGSVLLKNSAANVWRDETGAYTLRETDDGHYAVYDAADQLLFADEGWSSNEYQPADDELQDYGVLISVEDGVYPMFVATVDFPKSANTVSFDLNAAALGVDGAALEAMVGKTVSVHYTSDLEPDLYDIKFEGRFLLGVLEGERDDLESFTGILKNAGEVTMSDLPGSLTVEAANGEAMAFEYYIDPEMVAVNGKTITAYYAMRGKNVITKIEQQD